MKNIKITIVALFGLLLWGCSEEWLDQSNPNSLDNSSYFTTEDDAERAVVACYDPLKGNGMPPSVYYMKLFHAFDNYALHEQNYLENFSFNSGDGDVERLYAMPYRGLFRCNTVFKYVPDIPFKDEAHKQRRLGEAFLLRAFYSMQLAVNFNSPPLVLEPVKDLGITFSNTPQSVWFAQIHADLDSAATRLPSPNDLQPGELGRVNLGWVYALKGKACIYESCYQGVNKWAEAKEAFDKLLDLGYYELSSPPDGSTDSADYVNAYMANFTFVDLPTPAGRVYEAENNKESIIEIQNDGKTACENLYLPGWMCSGSLMTAWYGLNGYKNVGPSRFFAEQVFERTVDGSPAKLAGLNWDPRRTATIYTQGDDLDFREGRKYSDLKYDTALYGLPFMQGYGLKKYFYPVFEDVEVPGAPSNDPNNWRLIRLSEVYLWYAEADYHLGNTTGKGLELLNKVRARAGMNPISALTPEVIAHERDVEFGMEGKHYEDLVRWLVLGDPSWPNATQIPGFRVGKNEFFPMPLFEINYNKGSLKQNPGW